MYPQNKRISISVAFIYGDNIFYNLYHHISEHYVRQRRHLWRGGGTGPPWDLNVSEEAGDTIGEIFLHFTK